MSSSKNVFFLKAAETPWQPYVPPYVPEGYDAGKVRLLRRRGEGDRAIDHGGTWRGTPDNLPPGTKVTYERTETIFIIEGRVLIETEAGEKVELGVGDAMSFDKGSTVSWTILSKVYEEFFLFNN